VENGSLRITALVEKTKWNKYTSTRLVTKRKATFKEGYFEVRAKFPVGEGLRSAFWMVGDTVSKIGWPNAGEINLVEHYGKFPTVANAAVQTPRGTWQKNQAGGSVIVPNAETEFHIYSCHWTSERIAFAVDGQVYWTYEKPLQYPDSGYPFKWPFYMVANLSVGGLRGPIGQLNQDIFPANFYLDYVRVYKSQQ
ncbi:MAG: glycoside hydrolase family 16 protein, partial [Bacteroidota bacterium]